MSGHTATHRVLSAHDEFEARASEDEMKRAAASAAAVRTASFVQTTLLHSGLDGIIGLKKCLLSRLINSTASSISIMPLQKMMRYFHFIFWGMSIWQDLLGDTKVCIY